VKIRAVLILIAVLAAAAAINWRAAGQKADENATAPIPEFRTATAFAVSLETRIFSNRPDVRTTRAKGTFGVSEPLSPREPASGPVAHNDRENRLAAASALPMPTPSLSFDGLSNFDNIAAYNLVILPPDMNGDVGPNHYVQAVNALVRVYDKSGSPLTPAFKLSQLFGPLGTPCSTRNDGLPIVQYDPLADRWLISQYCNNFPPFRQLIAISKTGDPTGAYFLYEFVMPNNRINDFAKFGMWPDGYYMSTEEFLGSDYYGAGVFAFDRAKLLAGDASAGYVYVSRPGNSVNRRSNLLPSDLDGLRPPPAGAANVFVSYTANEYGDAQDAIRLFDFRPNFADPLASTFTERPESPVTVPAFDPTSPDGRADITQPAPGDKLDSNSDRINYRVAYRNFGSSESLVFNQTVRLTQDPSPFRAGVRMYEFRRNGASPFSIAEASTIGETTASRWIGSPAQDHQGNLAVSYNFVNDEKEPSIMYTGRLATDPAGVFRQETPLVIGTGVQKAFGWRWGDYSSMSVDPVDDCTFWTTGEYFTQESEDFSEFTWLTRIGKFKFDECTAAPRATIGGSVTNAESGQPIGGVTIRAAAYSRSTDSGGVYANMFVIPGTYAVTASARGFRPQTVSVTVSNGQVVTQNFALQPVPVLETVGTSVSAESCGTNGAPDPGETVTVSVSLQNNGSLNTQNLTGTLLASGGVTNPGPPQNYGSLAVGGPAVSRPFTFTVAPMLECGGIIVMQIHLQDGAYDLGNITVSLRSGTPRIAIRQNFDRQSGPGLPQRWTSSASGGQSTWSTSRNRSTSGTKSLFSPDPNQAGVNELVSPVFRVTTASAKATFQNWYELETTFLRNRLYDGSVMEIRIGSGDWQDIMAAGGLFESGGYDGTIDGCCQNPLAGRLGWSGRSGVNQVSEFITTSVRLPASAAGQLVQLRWRIGTDIGTFREGQYIDDLEITDGYVCSCGN
jgi:Carboxypeptidase regulatory-like domain